MRRQDEDEGPGLKRRLDYPIKRTRAERTRHLRPTLIGACIPDRVIIIIFLFICYYFLFRRYFLSFVYFLR